jgi:aminopeptidase N
MCAPVAHLAQRLQSAGFANRSDVFRACNRRTVTVRWHTVIGAGATVAPVTPLTRDAARARSAALQVRGYRLDLDLTSTVSYFGSRTTLQFDWRGPARPTFLDVAPHELRSVTLNGAALDLTTAFDAPARRLHLRPEPGPNEIVVDAAMAYSHDGEGLHRHLDPADGRTYLYAMSFLDAAPRWFACFDQPDLKAPVTIDVRCPPGWQVAGNGAATELAPGRWHLESAGPLATYFTTLVAGPYHAVRAEHDGIPLVLHVRQSLAEYLDRAADELFEHTRRSFDRLHALFGVRYPWGEYHQAFVPDFNAGAMENPGCVTLRDAYVFRSSVTDADRLDRAITVAHEMAHMWFGDLVTMRWWDDLWLNESFAEYLGHRVIGTHSWVEFGAKRKAWGYIADRRPSTHPVAGNGAADTESALTEFDGISYAKGASVLRQLAAQVGDDVFLGGLRRHIAGHAHGNAEFADLMAAWTAAGAQDLDRWARGWLLTAGLDELSAADGVLTRRRGDDSSRPHAVTIGAYAADGGEVGTVEVTAAADRTPLGLPPAALTLPDARDETWAKVTLTPADWQAMPVILPGVRDARTRVAIWTALRLAVADAEVDPRAAVDLAVAALPTETDDAIITAAGDWLGRTVAAYLSDANRDDALDRMAECGLAITHAAAAGSGRQLAAARVAIEATADRELLRAWLADERLPAGLVVDTELRWAALTQLSRLGDLTVAEIGAELAADNSAAGVVHAARCRSARPDPAEKAAIWETMMRDQDIANYELYASAGGFWDPHQKELTAVYAPRYFAEIAATSGLRTGWVRDRFVALAYPWPIVEQATVAATQELLAADELDAGVRRSVVDAGDDLRRALVARERFGC